MTSTLATRVVSVLSVLGISIVFLATEMGHSSVARAQNNTSGTQKKTAVSLTTDPSPAQKGSNTIQVKLPEPAGQPITGAEVTATFFMPAMVACRTRSEERNAPTAYGVRRQGTPSACNPARELAVLE